MILQDFLLSGLISIGDEDKRLEWLDAAAAALAKDFRKHKRKIANAVLVAMDENLPETEPFFDEVEAIVLIHWKALRGMYPDRPRNILRAVILAALDKLRDDTTACTISWLIGGSYLPYSHLGRERSIVETLIRSLGDIAEKEATISWTIERTAKDVELPAVTAKLEQPKTTKINEEWLRNVLLSAVGTGADLEHYPRNTNVMGNG